MALSVTGGIFINMCSAHLIYDTLEKFPAGGPHSLSWSADGKKIALADRFSVHIIDLASNVSELLFEYETLVDKVIFSPSNDHIAVLEQNKKIHIIKLSLYQNRIIGSGYDMKWNKDGYFLYYWNNDKCFQGTLNGDTADEVAYIQGDWSIFNQVVFCGENNRIKIADRDGSGAYFLDDVLDSTAINGMNTWGDEVKWSPDGYQIAFSQSSDKERIYIAHLLKKECYFLIEGWKQKWSPNGEKILYSDRHEKEIFCIPLKDDASIKIGEGSNPIWSPSGKEIAFVSDYSVFIQKI